MAYLNSVSPLRFVRELSMELHNSKQSASSSKTSSPSHQKQQTTHFGFEQVPLDQKEKRVAGVFSSVANKYDLMNDIMSLGSHRLFKRFTVELSGVRRGHIVLDLAGGTGDLTKLFSRIVGDSGMVYLTDINADMLSVGRDRLTDAGIVRNVQYIQANGEYLPYPDSFFDCITIGYGIRNFTNKENALVELYRVLKPGGRFLILEFSTPNNPLLGKAYDAYSKLWPTIGKTLVGDAASYRYLVESIKMHPDQETLRAMMLAAGFDKVEYHNLLGGISAIHRGLKF